MADRSVPAHDRQRAVQAAVNATAVAAQAINDWGRDSTEAADAMQAARDAVTRARQLGAVDADFRNTRPA
jgi:Mrp family chromosome partitioning ATPase